jgi:hypothetical protein
MAVSHWIEHQTGCTATVTIQAGSQTLTAAEPPPPELAEALATIHALRAIWGMNMHSASRPTVVSTLANQALILDNDPDRKIDSVWLINDSGQIPCEH